MTNAHMGRGVSYFALILAAFALGGAQHPNAGAEPKQPAPQERSADALEAIATTYDKQAKDAERAPISSECEPGDDQRNSDLCAQWKAADAAADSAWWAKWSAWISGVSGLLVVGALCIALQSNRIARAGVAAQLRAWLTVKITDTIGFRMVNDQPHFHIRYVVKNIGQTPALDVSFFASMTFGEGPKSHLDETINHFNSAKIEWKDAILFPRDKLERRSSCEHGGEPPPRILKIGFYTVAKYKTVFDKTPRFTAHLYEVTDQRREDGLIDLDNPPYGDFLTLRANSDFLGYAS